MAEVFSRWGGTVSEYATLYDGNHPLLRIPASHSNLEASLRNKALQNIRDICRLVGDATYMDLDAVTDRVSLPMLRSVLDLTFSPHTFHHFASPSLITACIRLMSTVKRSGKPSPLSYEYGYVCFRIVMMSLGMCLLERSNDLDETIKDILSDPYTAPLFVFSEHVSKVVQKEIHLAPSNKYWDYVLGWAQLDKRAPREPLVMRSDAAMLLDLLYDDRKYFLKSIAATYSPGLSGVFFLLWRCWRLERMSPARRDLGSLKRLASPFCELLWRYWLVATTDQAYSLMLIQNDIGMQSQYWEEKFVDVEDSRTVVRALIDRLLLPEEFLYAPLAPSALLTLMMFVTPFVEHGAKDLYPLLLRSTVKRMWNLLVDESLEDVALVDSMRDTILCLTRLIKYVLPISLEAGEQIIDSVIESDLLGLVARMMTLLKPVVGGMESSELMRNAQFLSNAENFFGALCKHVPKQLIKSKFRAIFDDWLKYKSYFDWRSEVTSVSEDEETHWSLCGACLNHILESTEQLGQMGLLRAVPMLCNYARCPNPFDMTGAQFACSRCLNIYCSARCQTADWTHGSWQKAHKELC